MIKTFKLQILPAFLALIFVFTTLPFIESIARITARAQAAITWHGVDKRTQSGSWVSLKSSTAPGLASRLTER